MRLLYREKESLKQDFSSLRSECKCNFTLLQRQTQAREELATKIKLYIENYKKSEVSNLAIFESKDKQMSDFVIGECIASREIAIITGEAGSEKSTIAKEWKKKAPNVILIEITLHNTASVLLKE